MTDLTKQLEDKKKGCGYTTYVDLENQLAYMKCDSNGYCPQCKAEIAILEQAMAEIKMQRQEFRDACREKDLHQRREHSPPERIIVPSWIKPRLVYSEPLNIGSKL